MTKSPFSDVQVLDFIDRPRLKLAQEDLTSQLYLAIWHRDRGDDEIWFYAAISPTQANAIKNGQMDLRDPFMTSSAIFQVEGETAVLRDPIPEDQLPPRGDRL